MRKTLGILTIGFLVACGGSDKATPGQQQYETVQEGAASGVTSTIHGPGEIVPPMTGTNADTTSAFTINPALANAPATPPGTLAGALPTQPYGGTGSAGYTPPPSSRTAQPPVRPNVQPQRGDTTWRTEPTTTTTAEPVTTEPTTDTAEEATPPVTQTNTEPPPPAEKPVEKPKEEPPPPATETQKTDTQKSEPPPPPPPA